MALAAGTRLGPYEVVALIGEGGMGQVYRARDTKLNRDVALKVLPDTFTSDPDRVARFQREARVLASLNHPNIAAIYGAEEAGGVQALVLELVEGPTLADRIARGPIPLDEAVPIARQIAEALDAAHEANIIHRDLKPANIKVKPNGVVKVLDFGLAKALDPQAAPGVEATSASTTLSPQATRAGMILGTAGYMSPEQARGQRADAQSDIWAFGCVVYEMLAGRAAFARATFTDTMAAVIDREPDWTALPRSTPESIVRLLHRALEKNRSRRLHAIADARLELDEPREPTRPAPAVTSSPRSARPLMLGGALVAFILILGVVGLRLARGGGRAPSSPPTRLSIVAPGQVTPQTSVAVSPEGRRLAFVSTDAAGRSMLWVRDLDALAPHALAGTEDAAHPFWAPDGSAIGFLAGGKLKRVDAEGGAVLTLADVTVRSGATWSSSGVILFAPRAGELATVPATGGSVSTVLEGQDAGAWPSFLPDGRHFLFFWRNGADNARGVYVGSLGSHTRKLILPSDFQAVFSAPDYLLFLRGDGLLFAQHLDLERLELTGDPTAVGEGVWSFRGAARASVSAAGSVLAYGNKTLENTEVRWFDRTGRSLGTVGEPGPYQGASPRIAPDGARVAVAHGASGGEVWVTRLADGTAMRLTLQPGALQPIWSSDSSRILFQWARGPGDSAVSIEDADGNGSARLFGAIGGGHVWDWSPDGRQIVFGRDRPADLWILPPGGDAVPFARSPFNKTEAQIAPDGCWIAYTSYESGHDEVYVDSFPTAGSRRQISVGGGMQPRWRRNGTELFYLAPDQMLMAVPVKGGPGRFETGRATPLFRTRLVPQGSQATWFDTLYDVTADGQRFLVNGRPADPGPPMTVVLNWTAGLK